MSRLRQIMRRGPPFELLDAVFVGAIVLMGSFCLWLWLAVR